MRFILQVILFSVCSFTDVFSQTITDLFQSKNTLSKDYHSVAGKYEALEINKETLLNVRNQPKEEIQLQLPFEGKQMILQLKKSKIITEHFSVVEALSGGERRKVSYTPGTFYQGKIAGASTSFVTISIVDGQVFGIIADQKSNIILGSIEKDGKATDEYVLYREPDLKVNGALKCFTGETPDDGPYVNPVNQNARLNTVGEPVEVYFECDYKFYQDKGSNTTNVINYVLSFFNNTALLYANENIKIQVSQILVWTTQDPEVQAGLTTTQAYLTSFRNRMQSTTYIGDYAHYLSTRSLGGGIAYLLSNPCTSTNKAAVSAINNTYNNFPTYSWTVEVVTHELGHNLGSNHTHWCGWPGGPIDWCAPTYSSAYIEGSCTSGPLPPAGTGGTIMSYCHLLGSIGINFNNGFGPLPGDKIRAVVGNATCFGNCRMTIDISKTDASCNLNTGSATVTVNNGTGDISYLWNNGQTGATLTNVGQGTYNVKVADAAGCQVMQVVSIGNTGTSLPLTLSPSGSAGICTGASLLLTATENPSYTYIWRKNGSIISGATTSSYNATSAGTYSVTASLSTCSNTQSIVVSIVPPPDANITPGGATTFCDGDDVTLNGSAGVGYSYQWLNNGNPIDGATSANYTVTTSGSYTVYVAAGDGCDATSDPVVVTVNPSPANIVTPSAATSFCIGESVTLNASAGNGYDYQWYNNGNPVGGASGPSINTNVSGNYTVQVTLGPCTKTSDPVDVIVWPNPTITISPAISTIEKFHTQELTASGASIYNWSSQPGLISGFYDNAIFKPLTTTNYIIEGSDINGCNGTGFATINVIGCGDISEMIVTPYSPSRVTIKWKNPDGVTEDTLQYRKVGSSEWLKIYVTGEEYELNGLTPGTNYEYRITPLCNTTTVFTASNIEDFLTAGLNGKTYIKLFPNPVSTNAKLEIITEQAYELSVSIFDNTGRKIRDISSKESLPAGQVIKSINAGILANGIYSIAVYINDKVQLVKMLVMH